jgi:hypothetical protein
MYRPDINNHDLTPITFQFEKIKIPSGNRIELNSWFSFKDSKKKTLVFFMVTQEISETVFINLMRLIK